MSITMKRNLKIAAAIVALFVALHFSHPSPMAGDSAGRIEVVA